MGLQLVTSFIGAAKVLGAQRQTAQRQLTAEKKKNSEGLRVESLSKRLSETHEKITMVEEMMRKIFTGYYLLSLLCGVLVVLATERVEISYSLKFTYVSLIMASLILLKVVCPPLSRYRSRNPHVMHTIAWSMDLVISIIVSAGFVLEVSWMDIE